MAAYPLNHAHQLLQRLLPLLPSSLASNRHYIYLIGDKVHSRHDTDRELPFRQESNFYYLTGFDEPGAAFVLEYEPEQGGKDEQKVGKDEIQFDKVKTTLLLPEVVPDEVMWCGMPPSAESISKKLNFTRVETGWTPIVLAQRARTPSATSSVPTTIHHLPWDAPPSAAIQSINGPTATSEFLIKALHEARRNKTAIEIDLMRKASEITAGAHLELMKAVGRNDVKDENAAEAVFVGHCRKHGAKHQAYTPIMAAGANAGTLHYVANDLEFRASSPGALMLVDAGAEYKNYAADVTRCIPLGNGGKFTEECKQIYNLVLEMQMAAFDVIKAGTIWEDVQFLVHRVAIQGLLKLGIFVKGSFSGSEQDLIEKILRSGASTAIYPHGLGHLLGLDVHDVGGLPLGKEKDPVLKYLRLQKVPLEKDFVVTVEPGIYFNEFLLAPFKNCEFIDFEVLQKYSYVGGVRIEDNILITETGFENLTPSWLPKTIEQIEAVTRNSQ